MMQPRPNSKPALHGQNKSITPLRYVYKVDWLRTENTRNKSWGLLKQKIKKLAKDNFITCRVIHIKGETIFLNPKNKKYVLQTEV